MKQARRRKRGTSPETQAPKRARATSPPGRSPEEAAGCPVVGVGASAGGLEAFNQLLQHIPENTGMAFVLIQHLDPTHTSILAEVIARATPMPVQQIQDGMVVTPDHVYVIPPNADVGILKGVFTLLPRPKERLPQAHAVDFFFRALAADRRNKAIGVVLSGTGADGTDGLGAIKSEDGVTFAQEPRTATFSGMPESAVAAGVVDFVAPIPELAKAILRVARHPYVQAPTPEPLACPPGGDDDDLRRILHVLRSRLGIDFSEYKLSTISRRLGRRMALRQQASLRDYLTLLQEDPAEAKALYEDLLVNVTSFFRDAEVFEKLGELVLPEILKAKPEGGAIRIWVPGCSTGEEAYSIAILLLEVLGGGARRHSVQIFASDVSEMAIAKARAGFYSDNAVRGVSPARLRTFFTRVEGGYQIHRSVRDLCIFVRHNLASDPPFSKLDLLSCRNVLIYFNPTLQARVIATFHFALNLPGFLFLGRSENLVDPGQMFSVVDKEAKIFARTLAASTLRFPPARQVFPPPAQPAAGLPPPRPTTDLVGRAESLLLNQYAPPGVVVDGKGEILHFRGHTGPYLEPAPGQPQHNLFKMAREGLLADLRIAFSQATKTKAAVRRTGVWVRQNGSSKACDLVILPLPAAPGERERSFLVLFEESRLVEVRPERKAKLARGKARGGEAARGEPRAAKLAQELEATKEYLQSLINEHQRTNEDLAAANEEMVASNEELQSLNEELETAKEELQSTNEELVTLNDELQSRNDELHQLNSDLSNVLSSVEIPIVIVNGARRLRRFTPRARPIMNLLPSDVGRPIGDIKPNLEMPDLDALIAEVIDTVEMKELEVQDREGRWYRLQLRPYLTPEKRIDGVVLAIIEIDALKRALTATEWARDYAAGTVEAVLTPLVVLDGKLRVLSANEAFYTTFATSRDQTEGRSLYELGAGHWDVAALREHLEETAGKGARFQRFEVECEPSGLGHRVMSLSGRPIPSLAGVPMVLLAIEDVTPQKRIEAERVRLLAEAEEAKKRAEEANRTKDIFLATLSHELRTPLSTLLLQAQLLRRGDMDAAKLARASAAIERAAKTQAQLIDDLLDVSRIVTGKLRLEPQEVELSSIARSALETVRPMAEKKSLALEAALDESPAPVSGDPVRLQQVVLNLLTNAIKFTPAGGRISLSLERAGEHARLRVSDTGVGIAPDFLPHVFDMFTQADPSMTRAHGGMGLGLAIARHLVEAHGGTIRVESSGAGKGATFSVTLPLLERPREAAAPRPGAPARPVRHGLQGVRLLLIDDDPGTRQALAEMLAISGAEVRAAESAAQAMAMFEELQPDLLVCDIAMPVEDGYSLLKRIRARGPARGGDLPAVALTALAGKEDRERALAAGFQLHVPKPVDIDRLVEALSGLLSPVPTFRNAGRVEP